MIIGLNGKSDLLSSRWLNDNIIYAVQKLMKLSVHDRGLTTSLAFAQHILYTKNNAWNFFIHWSTVQILFKYAENYVWKVFTHTKILKNKFKYYSMKCKNTYIIFTHSVIGKIQFSKTRHKFQTWEMPHMVQIQVPFKHHSQTFIPHISSKDCVVVWWHYNWRASKSPVAVWANPWI